MENEELVEDKGYQELMDLKGTVDQKVNDNEVYNSTMVSIVIRYYRLLANLKFGFCITSIRISWT